MTTDAGILQAIGNTSLVPLRRVVPPDCARIFVPAAMRRARRSVRALGRNQDDRLKAMAQRALQAGELVPEV